MLTEVRPGENNLGSDLFLVAVHLGLVGPLLNCEWGDRGPVPTNQSRQKDTALWVGLRPERVAKAKKKKKKSPG